MHTSYCFSPVVGSTCICLCFGKKKKKKVVRDIKRAILLFFLQITFLHLTEIFLLVQINPAVTFIHRTNPTEMLSQKVCFTIVQSLYVKGMKNRSEETNGFPGTKRAGGLRRDCRGATHTRLSRSLEPQVAGGRGYERGRQEEGRAPEEAPLSFPSH